MRQRILTAMVVLAMTASGIAGVSAAAQTYSVMLQADEPGVTFENQTTGGDQVTVSEVTVPDGGYVTIHDASLGDGNVLGSVAGTSSYLSAGTHENVTVTLTDDVNDGSFFAMAHQETDGDRTYEFVSSNGEMDGPYTMDGSPVMDDASLTVSASVSMADQPTNGDSVVVDRVVLSEGGFVTLHDASVTEGEVFESIRGTSSYLGPGVHENVRVSFDDPLSANATLVPMAHQDTDDDQSYTFAQSEGETDGPYANGNGDAVVDTSAATVTDTARATFENQSTGGNRVVVDSVYVPEGGFVTIHDESVTEGAVFDSVRGTSTYLEPGLHNDVAVALQQPVEESSTLVAMPHMDTDDDMSYSFVASEGENDGPYTEAGSAVVDTADVTHAASISFDAQSSDGTTVTIRSVDMSEGGFIAVHDETLLDGAVLDSVVGHSDYLEAGVHENVTVTLDTRLRDTQTLVPMPHMDTDGDEAYTFVESEGSTDGPYTADGGAVVDTGPVTVEAGLGYEAESGDGTTVTVPSVTLQDGGFVTVHDASVTDGAVFESIRGTSAYLAPGTHENVTITLDEPVEETTTLVPMAHRDTDGDDAYTFAESEGSADGPYLGGGGPVVATGEYSVETGAMDDTETPTTSEMTTEAMDAGAEGSTTESGPGFGVVVAIGALVGVALILVKRHE